MAEGGALQGPAVASSQEHLPGEAAQGRLAPHLRDQSSTLLGLLNLQRAIWRSTCEVEIEGKPGTMPAGSGLRPQGSLYKGFRTNRCTSSVHLQGKAIAASQTLRLRFQSLHRRCVMNSCCRVSAGYDSGSSPSFSFSSNIGGHTPGLGPGRSDTCNRSGAFYDGHDRALVYSFRFVRLYPGYFAGQLSSYDISPMPGLPGQQSRRERLHARGS